MHNHIFSQAGNNALSVVEAIQSDSRSRVIRGLRVLAVTCLLALTVTCGGNTSTIISAPTPVPPAPTPAPPPSPPPNTMMQVKIGDSPVDAVVAFEVGITSPIVLTPTTGGANVNIAIPASNRLELSHMAAKMEPLTVLNVPQGSYSSATITLTSPVVEFVGNPKSSGFITGNNQTITVNFNPPLTIGSSPGILNFDVNLANSVISDPTSGIITGINFTPASFNVTTASVAPQAQQQDNDGELEDETGMVTAVNGSSLTITAGQSGAQLTFVTDGSTVFDSPLTGVSGTLNQIVRVEGVTRADGSLLATEVEGVGASTGAEVEGWVVGVIAGAGGAATTIAMGVQDGIGNGMAAVDVGAGFNVDVSSLPANKYEIAKGSVDLTGLTVPGPAFPFGPTSIIGGQRVEVVSSSALPIPNATFSASLVKLKQQTVSGQVTAVNGSAAPRTIVITLPVNSAVRIDSRLVNSSVTVFEQPGTNDQLPAINVGDTIRIRGLLFNASGAFNMIARRITP
jgi:hypothetical protein